MQNWLTIPCADRRLVAANCTYVPPCRLLPTCQLHHLFLPSRERDEPTTDSRLVWETRRVRMREGVNEEYKVRISSQAAFRGVRLVPQHLHHNNKQQQTNKQQQQQATSNNGKSSSYLEKKKKMYKESSLRIIINHHHEASLFIIAYCTRHEQNLLYTTGVVKNWVAHLPLSIVVLLFLFIYFLRTWHHTAANNRSSCSSACDLRF
jgi:hypothetical protein